MVAPQAPWMQDPEFVGVPRHAGPVRRYKWCHLGRQDALLEREKIPHGQVNLVMREQQSGWHAVCSDLEDEHDTIHLGLFRYCGDLLEYAHNWPDLQHDLMFRRVTPASKRGIWDSDTFPIRIFELDDDVPGTPHSDAVVVPSDRFRSSTGGSARQSKKPRTR